MDIVISAILGELTSQSINFIINRYSRPPSMDMENSLQRALLRAEVIVDEAMGRHITNQAMLQQLDMLRDSMHRGYYTLDTFRYQHHDEKDAKYQAVSRSRSLSKINSAKALCFPMKGAQFLNEMRHVLDNLSSMILDANDLVLFLMSYPCLYRQPYSMHILLGNCMFGRQTEAEFVIHFLLQMQPHGAEKIDILPIIGPSRVGKSTLVGHVCKDDRVRDHFSQIVFLSGNDFVDEGLSNLKRGCAMEHQNCTVNSNKNGGLLLIVEVTGDLNEDAGNRLCYVSKQWMPTGGKIIITSQSEKIRKFGTTQALTLKYLSHEAYWYFFKTLTFGSTDPRMHPKLAHLAMEIARMLKGPLPRANITASLLRDNFDIHFWLKVVGLLRRSFQRHASKFDEHPFDLMDQTKPASFGRMATPSEDLVILHQYQRSSEEDVPEITIQDVIYGSAKPHGKFEVLAWRSRIPPYHCYVYDCEVRELKSTAIKRKRYMKNGVMLC